MATVISIYYMMVFNFLNQDNSNFITNFEYYVTGVLGVGGFRSRCEQRWSVGSVFSVANNVAFIDQSNGTSSVRKIIYQCGTSTKPSRLWILIKMGILMPCVVYGQIGSYRKYRWEFFLFKTLSTSTVFFDQLESMILIRMEILTFMDMAINRDGLKMMGRTI